MLLRSLALAACLLATPALAAPDGNPLDSVHLGLSAHDVGGSGADGADLSFELRFDPLFGRDWSVSILPTLGGSLHLGDGANIGYLGATGRVMLTDSIFAEAFFGFAVHDADVPRASDEADLGCSLLFREGAALGYLRGAHSVSLHVSHVSHGGILCDDDENDGLTSVGMRYGYHF